MSDPDRAALSRLAQYLANVERWRADPILYAVERLKVSRESLDWGVLPQYQGHVWDGTPHPFRRVAEAVVDWKWVAVESATSTGKTFFGAILVDWFLECFEDSLVITVAPKSDQLKLHIWKELGSMYERFGLGEMLALQIRMEPPFDKWTAIGFVAGVNAEEVGRSATRAQGFHAKHMMVILEETPGIHAAIITAFRNTCVAPHNLIVAFGNPDHEYDNLHQFTKLSKVIHVRISAYDHPNVVCKDPEIVPGATSEGGIANLLESYGSMDNPLFLSRARGISPAGTPDSLIRIEWCTEARNRGLSVDPQMVEGTPALGVDVANSERGDKAAIAFGKGTNLLTIESFACPSSNKLGDTVAQRMADEHVKEERVGVDAIGVGAGTYNQLRDVYSLRVNPLNTTSVVTRGIEKFVSLRAQMWWQMREDLRLGRITLPNDPELFADLVTPKWERRDTVLIVEAKEELKKRLGRSPDKGDAAVYWNWVRERRDAETLAFPRFKRDKHVGTVSFNRGYPLYVSVQFDREPSVWLIAQHQAGELCVLREVVMVESDLWKMCDALRVDLETMIGAESLLHPIVFFGERERGVSSTASAWEVLKAEFKLWNVQYRVKLKHTEIEVRHSLNAMLETVEGVKLRIDPSVFELLRDMETVTTDRLEANASEGKASPSVCLGYVVNYEFPVQPQPIGRQL